MPLKLKPKARELVTLEFEAADGTARDTHRNLSCVAQSGANLWLGSDESVCVERLTWDAKRKAFCHHTRVKLTTFFDLPAGADREIDLEGMSFVPPYLWLTGSHSSTRGKVAGRSFEQALADLTTIERVTNRHFLARVPLVETDGGSASYELRAHAVHPGRPERAISAARLFATGATSVVTDALRCDELLRPYLELPSKDNGLDVEGLAVVDDRVLLGLRGPVLRGWAVVLELEPEHLAPECFSLRPIGREGKLYRRHFFDLMGLGIRDLVIVDDTLLILAGPTMAIDGRVVLLRWKKFRKRKKESVVTADDLELVHDFGGGDVDLRGKNHPEGITLFTPPDDCDLPPGVLVVYDSPAGAYLPAKREVAADLIPIRQRRA